MDLLKGNEKRITAPQIDGLLRCFDRGFQNSEKPTRALMDAMDPLFAALSELAPCKANDEAKIIWLTAPRGDIADFGDYEEYREYGDEWYFGKRGGGHPWEVVPGGNSTHVELYVCHDRNDIEWKHRSGEIDGAEYEERKANAGYYFHIAGRHRPEESFRFFVALRKAGLPVIISDAEEMIARYEGTDYIGIVPHRITPKYCEEMFPEKYGNVIDFMNVYSDEIDKLKDFITWLPEEEAHLLNETVSGRSN